MSMNPYDVWSDEQRDAMPEWTTINTRIQVARKPHACAVCQGAIPAGAKYLRTVALEDGKFLSLAEHYPTCPAVIPAVCACGAVLHEGRAHDCYWYPLPEGWTR